MVLAQVFVARFTQSGYGTRNLSPHCTQLGYGARSFEVMLPQFEHGARSFGALGARCTQFCPTVHAVEARCTQFFAGSERRDDSSTCAFDASRSFRGLRNCVYRTPVACSVGQNCVQHGQLREPCDGRPRQDPKTTPSPFSAFPARSPSSRPASAEPHYSCKRPMKGKPDRHGQ